MPRRHAIGSVALLCWLLGGCGGALRTPEATYQVRAQDTLYSIAWRHNLDYRDLARWNHLGPDYRITVGQILTLRPGEPAPTAPRETAAPMPAWNWPTKALSPARKVAGGILVPGVLGQQVHAASGGRVVYVGNALRGYGNLIIVKHAETLLSAYAHNADVLVKEGDSVAGGQPIAHMGFGESRSPDLYFEIRQNGKPLDPLALLPQ